MQSLWDFEMFEQLREHLEGSFGYDMAEKLMNELNIDEWLYKTGMPPVTADFTTEDSRAALKLAAELLTNGKFTEESVEAYHTFYTNQRIIFFNGLINQKEEMTKEKVANLIKQLGIKIDQNMEITSRTCRLALITHADGAADMADTLLGMTGRLEFLLPIFHALKDNGYTKEMHAIYEKNKAFYSPIARNQLKPIVGDEVFGIDAMAEHWAQRSFTNVRM